MTTETEEEYRRSTFIIFFVIMCLFFIGIFTFAFSLDKQKRRITHISLEERYFASGKVLQIDFREPLSLPITNERYAVYLKLDNGNSYYIRQKVWVGIPQIKVGDYIYLTEKQGCLIPFKKF